MSAVDISASIMCGRLAELSVDIQRLEKAGVDSLHVDVMDGHFVPNLTFGPDIVRAVRQVTNLKVHVHMMVTDPERYVALFADAGADVYLFHIEATRYPRRLISQVASAGMTAGAAVNPSTPVEYLDGLDVSLALLMSVEPGFAGQSWVPATESRLTRVRDIVAPNVVIGVDGNLTLTNVSRAAELGATLFVCGSSSLFRDGLDYADAVARIRKAAHSNRSTATAPVA